VLRGTLDISVLINILGNVKIGQTGNVVLIDREGTVLYSHVPAQIMKPTPEMLLRLFESGESGWQQATDVDGEPSIVAYSFLGGNLGKTLDWRMAITQQQAEVNHAVLRSTLISVLASALVATLAILISATIMSRSIAAPLGILTKKAQELSIGNIIRDGKDGVTERLHLRRDEIGAISRAFERLTVYFQGAAAASTAIANKDLTITVSPNSDKDEMGVAFTKMLVGLQQAFGQVAGSSTDVSSAASQLAAASAQSGQASNQIAQTIQQVALGTVQQNEEMSKTSCSVEQLNRAINKVANGAQDQAQALGKASTLAIQISSTVQQVTSRAQTGVDGAAEATKSATSGAQTIQATIEGLQTIRSKVGLSAQKVREMGLRSEQIDAIAETIDEIASQTDLLALNAAIEAARVEGHSEMTVEAILQHHMLGAANLLARLLEENSTLESCDLASLARQAQVRTSSFLTLTESSLPRRIRAAWASAFRKIDDNNPPYFDRCWGGGMAS
jgi:methyl-accepting chemotaxis protein